MYFASSSARINSSGRLNKLGAQCLNGALHPPKRQGYVPLDRDMVRYDQFNLAEPLLTVNHLCIMSSD
jgi:hypothetical protein